MDRVNQAIVKLLKANSRMSWQQIGKEVHLTGQAVAARVQQMEEQGLISGYTIRQDGLQRHFITMFMENPNFDEFERFLGADLRVEGAYKVTGEGCYLVVYTPTESHELEPFLNSLLRYGRYRVSTAIRCIKS